MYLHNDIKDYFTAGQPIFEQMMALRGICYRHQEGRLTQKIMLGTTAYFIKQHHGVGWKEIFKNLFQFRWPVLGAKNEFLAIEKLQALQVPVPAVVAYDERGSNPARRQSFILMKELTPIISLEDYCKDWSKQRPSYRLKQTLIKEVARIARTMHTNGINHRDFYLCHFLLDQTPAMTAGEESQRKPTLYLIDLHRAQIRALAPKRGVIKDLSGLYFSSNDIGLSSRDLYRFMVHYRGTSLRAIVGSEKNFWQKVKLRGEQLYSKHRR